MGGDEVPGSMSTVDYVVIGAGAAGLGAARRLRSAGRDLVVIEARRRVGGRAWTVETPLGLPVDLGCGWLHSADRNPLTNLARANGFSIDERLPNWSRGGDGDKTDWRSEFEALEERIAAWRGPDLPAAELVEPHGPWNAALDAISSYVSGAELAAVSVYDLARYHDSGINWRVREGLGAAVAALSSGLRVEYDAAATRIDRSGRELRIETARGTLRCRAAIVTLPTSLVGELVPEKAALAAGVPLGLANKLYFALDGHEEFPADHHFLGATDRSATGSYQVRPHGRPLVEVFFGGSNARALESSGAAAMTDFALEELAGKFGTTIRRRLRVLAASSWGADPWSRGAYSYARPGHAGAREALAQPLEERLFFAGEATSRHDFSTAHGAYLTGVAAAEAALSARA
jgi:monoamine oxidase